MMTAAILYVDDELNARTSFKRLMRNYDLTVDVVGSGQEALALVAQTSYAVVVTDLRMPQMDGYELIGFLRKQMPEASFIVVSGNLEAYPCTDEQIAPVIMDSFTKPWQPDELAHALRRALELHQKRINRFDADESIDSATPARILLLEDDNIDAEKVIHQLQVQSDREFNYHLTRVSSVSEGIQALAQENYSVLIADLFLPDSEGLLTVSRLVAATDIPLIVLTNPEYRGMASQALKLGAHDYLDNSCVEAESLHRAIAYALERHYSHGRYQMMLVQNPDGIIVVDPHQQVLFANPAAAMLFERSVEQLVGGILEFPSIQSDTMEVQLTSGKHVEMHAAEISWDKTPAFLYCLRDITNHKKLEDKLQYLALHDSLTGLANRSLLLEQTEYAIREAKRTSSVFAVLMLDLDRFKLINDTLGHDIGDLLLKECATRLYGAVRESDMVARLGGDEFVVLMQNIEQAKNIVTLSNKILAIMESPFLLADKAYVITASIGIALYPQDGDSAGTLLKNADAAMYRAKRAGRNHFCFFDASIHLQTMKRLKLESELARAIEQQEFELHYQPQLNDTEIVGMEALIRWKHPERGLIPPVEFIPMLEETGYIRDVEPWIIRTALCQLSQWNTKYNCDWRMSINIAASTLQEKAFAQQIELALEEYNVKPSLLEIEITETTLLVDEEKAKTTLGNLQELGVQIALDDFGTGYCSLAYLLKYPFFTTLKIDREFVQKMCLSGEEKFEENRNLSILKAILDLAHVLNMRVVAEGVETVEQLTKLKDMHCDLYQGFLFSKPVKASDWPLLLENLREDAQQRA